MEEKNKKEGFGRFLGSKVFLITKSGRQYSGRVCEVHDVGDSLIFISIIDKFNKWVTFLASEIEVIQADG